MVDGRISTTSLFDHRAAPSGGCSPARRVLQCLLTFVLPSLCLCAASPAMAQDISDDVSFLARFAPSPDKRLIAAYAPDGPALWLFACCAPYKPLLRVDESVLKKFCDPPYVRRAEWSPDGKLLKIDLYDGDEGLVVVTLDPLLGSKSLKGVETGRGKAGIAAWTRTGHRLYAAPEIGLYVFDPDSRTATTVFAEQHVNSDIVVLPDRLLLRLADQRYGPCSLVAVDLRSGRKTVLVRQKGIDSK